MRDLRAETGSNGNGTRQLRRAAQSARPVPTLSVRALIEERNYPALAGLVLGAVGCLVVLRTLFDLDLSLFNLTLAGLGGWLMTNAWQMYQRASRTWTTVAQNRMVAGGLIALVALMGMISLDWWSLMLMVFGGWMGYDTWQRYEERGRVVDSRLRQRAWLAALVGSVGFFGFFGLGSAWPLVLIAAGVAMLYRRRRA